MSRLSIERMRYWLRMRQMTPLRTNVPLNLLVIFARYGKMNEVLKSYGGGGLTMIKDVMAANEAVMPNSKEMEVLKEHFPACFSKDGSFDIKRFQEFLSGKVHVTNEGYELKFLGKNYARLLASVDTTTVIVPDEAHNKQSENANSENIYISGDNLDGLKHLLKSYARKVKCIYIDPPYNTGSDGFVYNDDFAYTAEELSERLSITEGDAQRILDLTKRGSASHSAWLMFMYPRLLLARDLLTDDGVIFISIDDNEQGNLKLICDDVFGEEMMVSQLIIIVKPEGRRYGFFAKTHDYLSVYCKNKDKLHLNEIEVNGAEYQYFDENGGFNLTGLRNRNVVAFNSMNRPNLRYPFYVDLSSIDENSLCKVHLEKSARYIEVWPSVINGLESVWRWGKEKSSCNLSELVAYKGNDNQIRVFQKDRKLTQTAKTVWKNVCEKQYGELIDDKETISNHATKEIQSLLGKDIFDFPKPVKLIKNILQIGTDEDDIVLDFFSGSATTAQAAMELNVEAEKNIHYILVQLQEPVRVGSGAEKAGYHTIDQIGMERIQRAARQIREAHPDTMADLGFTHYTLSEPSLDTLDKLEAFSSEKDADLLLQNSVYADFGLDTVLATWLVHDGYGFQAPVQTLDLAGYQGYYLDKHLYLIEPDLSDEAIDAIITKFETDGAFNPDNLVLFGYNFTWSELETLRVNLKRLQATEKNLAIHFDIRY